MRCRTIRFLLADHLSLTLSSLSSVDPVHDIILMTEVANEATHVRYHAKKLAFLLSAMRHFAERLTDEFQLKVDYIRLDDPENTGSLRAELVRAVARHKPERVIVAFPSEHRLLRDMTDWSAACGVPVEVREDNRFFCGRTDFARWAQGRRQLRMEPFYRLMRERSGLLMTPEGSPEGGQWEPMRLPPLTGKADIEQHPQDEHGLSKPLCGKFPCGGKTTDLHVPEPFRTTPDKTTKEVLALVGQRFPNHFGELEPFWFAVTHADAERVFDAFCLHALPRFCSTHDLMRKNHATLFHAVIGHYLNVGLLDPRKICQRVEEDYQKGRITLSAAEGFIRQILGWREFARGLYWLKMPNYAGFNYFNAYGPLPGFFWSGETTMNCLKQCIDQTKREAYAHHTQRLTVLGNFSMLAGIAPLEVMEWFLLAFVDAVEWALIPNVQMALHADGGLFVGKPNAVGGKFVHHVSDYCEECLFEPDLTTGEFSCPLNYLYWNFLAANRVKLENNQRMRFAYSIMDKMPKETLIAIRRSAEAFLNSLG
ncbi:(6-4) photolyase [Azospirillaceae bacterium]